MKRDLGYSSSEDSLIIENDIEETLESGSEEQMRDQKSYDID